MRDDLVFREALNLEGAWFLSEVPPALRGSVPRMEVWHGGRKVELAVADWVLKRRVFPLHLAYLSRLRRMLGAELGEWEPVIAEGVDVSGRLPDALWYRGGRLVPVEVDLGQYSTERIVEKLSFYGAAYGQQIWGVLSERPVRLARKLRVAAEFLHLEGKGRWFVP